MSVCGKSCYPTRELALKALNGIALDKSPTRSKVHNTKSYWCDDCQANHLTSMYARKSVVVAKGHTTEIVHKKFSEGPVLRIWTRGFKVK